MILERNYIQRKDDVEEAYRLLQFLLEVESHINKPVINSKTGKVLYVTQEMQCVAKAQFLIVLYNLVESTVCDCLNSFYDAILDESLIFSSLSQDMKKMWKNYLKRRSHPDANKTDAEIATMPVKFEELAINISGSLDIRKILEVFRRHGCTLDETKREEYGNSFLTVKTKRNLLAHGNISFSKCGSAYLISDLTKYKNHILDFMNDVVASSKSFVENGLYKSIP